MRCFAVGFELGHVGEVDGGGVAAGEEGRGCVEGARGAGGEVVSDCVRRMGLRVWLLF